MHIAVQQEADSAALPTSESAWIKRRRVHVAKAVAGKELQGLASLERQAAAKAGDQRLLNQEQKLADLAAVSDLDNKQDLGVPAV